MSELASQQDLELTNYNFNEVLVEEKLGSFTIYNFLFNIGFIIFYYFYCYSVWILLHSIKRRLYKHRQENYKTCVKLEEQKLVESFL